MRGDRVRIAVLTLTRDRLTYTQHCFARLQERAGCEYDHYVLDQGSEDGTADWLEENYPATVVALDENIGCCAGWNRLLDTVCDPGDYDVIVCFDNDCELIQDGTLRVVAGLAAEFNVILSPRVMGLRNPPPIIGEFALDNKIDGHYAWVDETAILGNIFMAIPARLLNEYDWNENHPVWAGGEDITAWFRDSGGRCGYVRGYEVNHYETTDGQHDRFPEYFERRVLEGGPV